MTKKIERRDFQIKYKIHSIIGISVEGVDHEEAIARANEIINKKNIFIPIIEEISGGHILVGFDDMTAWDETEK